MIMLNNVYISRQWNLPNQGTLETRKNVLTYCILVPAKQTNPHVTQLTVREIVTYKSDRILVHMPNIIAELDVHTYNTLLYVVTHYVHSINILIAQPTANRQPTADNV